MKGLILTYLLAAVGTVGALRYPLLGLFTYVFLAILRPQFIFAFAGDMAGLSFWLGVTMLVGWALQAFGSWKFGRGRGVVAALLLFTLWFIVSSTLAIDTERSFPQVAVMARFILPVLVGMTLLDDAKLRYWMMWTIVLAQAYVGFEMNLMYLKGFNVAADGFGGMDNNCFAVSMVATIGPAVALMIGSKSWYERLAAAVASALILHTTLLTFSRGGLVGMLAVGLVAFVMMPKRPKYLAAVALVAVIALRLTGPQLAARYATTFASSDQRDGSAESRLDLWADCLKVVARYPMLGVGPANWKTVASSFGWTEGKSAHSVWMETAAETGFPGSLLLLSFFTIAAVKLWPLARARHTNENRYDVAIASGTVLSVVGFVVAGQFVSVPGLELPYYVVMVGTALLKNPQQAMAAAPAAPVSQAPVLHPAAARLLAGRMSMTGH